MFTGQVESVSGCAMTASPTHTATFTCTTNILTVPHIFIVCSTNMVTKLPTPTFYTMQPTKLLIGAFHSAAHTLLQVVSKGWGRKTHRVADGQVHKKALLQITINSVC